jgi:VWFA-related protein
MLRFVRASAVLSILGVSAAVTSAQSVPLGGDGLQPKPSDQAQPRSTQPLTGSVPTIQTNARLVIVDVMVTDHSGMPIHGLKATDFTLAENGTAQTVKNFEEHLALTAADAVRLEPMPVLPPDVFTNYTPAPPNGAVNVVLLDALNTPLVDQMYMRQQLLEYLKSLPPGARVAIFGLTDRLVILQSFTSDPAVLRSVLEKNRGKGSPLLDDQVGGGGIQNSVADNMEDMGVENWGVDADTIANVREFEELQQNFQKQSRIKYTLDAFNQLARYLAIIPGRKNVIWFSASFPIDILPDIDGMQTNPFEFAASFEDEFRQTTDLLGRSQVAVYPVDARGITSSPVVAATTTRNYVGSRGSQRMAQDQAKFFVDTTNEHSTMASMADATGGHAFYNTNDLTNAVAQAVDQGSNFYTLAYAPSDPTMDGKLRRIKVQTTHPGVTLTYRKGYYADPPEKISTEAANSASAMHDQAVTATNGLTPRETMRLAMTRGAPTPSDILMNVGVAPMTAASATESVPAPANSPTPKGRGPWRRYGVNYQIDPTGLVFFRGGDGKVHADFDLVVFVYSADGSVLNMLVNSGHVADTMDGVRQLIKEGIYFHQEVSAPAKGVSFLRIAVHDLHRDHYGVVEVATSQVKNTAMPQ